jgi:radical SAM-linked protein
MPRLIFEKTGNAVWISHLDLMRLFQRAFKRAGLPLTHTQGYNPRPSVSIALPLSVGVESKCELLEYELEGEEKPSHKEIVSRLNAALTEGIRVIHSYDNCAKIKNLAFLDATVDLEYDNGIPEDSRAAKSTGFLQQSQVTPERVEAVKQLALIAKERGQSIAQMALAWVLADKRVTSCIIGTSSVAQLENNLETLNNLTFSNDEIERINHIINSPILHF